jgi:hypothetical protein
MPYDDGCTSRQNLDGHRNLLGCAARERRSLTSRNRVSRFEIDSLSAGGTDDALEPRTHRSPKRTSATGERFPRPARNADIASES